MIVTNAEGIPGQEVGQVLGVVTGNVVQAKHVDRDILAGLKSISGGEIGDYSDLMTQAREKAHQRMVEAARRLGADAITNSRYTTSMIAQGMSEVLAFGTAVKLAGRGVGS